MEASRRHLIEVISENNYTKVKTFFTTIDSILILFGFYYIKVWQNWVNILQKKWLKTQQYVRIVLKHRRKYNSSVILNENLQEWSSDNEINDNMYNEQQELLDLKLFERNV